MAPRGEPVPLPRPGERIRLIAASCRPDAIQARRAGSPRALFVQPAGSPASSFADLPVEGESFELAVGEVWSRGPRRWLSGELSRVRLDVAALGLEPLALIEIGRWDPHRDQLTDVAAGRRCRVEYEIERIPASGAAAAGPEPCLHRAIELWANDRRRDAHAVLADLLRRDLRCLTAHACLGFFAFNAPPDRGGPARAQRHYEAGLGIARLSLPRDFDGVLPWSRPGNRPFLRCLYGHAICLWRRGDLGGARTAFVSLCRLNPADQLAARLALDRIESGGA